MGTRTYHVDMEGSILLVNTLILPLSTGSVVKMSSVRTIFDIIPSVLDTTRKGPQNRLQPATPDQDKSMYHITKI